MTATFLTPAEVAARLNCSRRYVYDQLGSGVLEGSFYANAWHVTPEAVEAFIAAHRRRAPAASRGRRRPRRDLTPRTG
jgi:excisionase family DNA binding protein